MIQIKNYCFYLAFISILCSCSIKTKPEKPLNVDCITTTTTTQNCKVLRTYTLANVYQLLRDTAARNSYERYISPDQPGGMPIDAFGFSIDSATVQFLANAMINDATGSIKGFRFYPGKSTLGVKEILIIALNSGGREISGSAFKPNIPSPPYTRGPCPKWCDNGSRIIINR
ncbi:MAG: hypothetical protein M3Q56_13090 [Bacteroidota bacterium]|nr:hypothetical protein [Bacteroidota bacterium]